MKRILTGVDGSSDADAAVGWSAAVASAVGAELIVATVVASGHDAPAGPWTAAAIPEGVAVRYLKLEGDAVGALRQAGVDEGADLLVVGSGSNGWFPAVHLDHVAHTLAAHAAHPIAIVPPQADRAPVTRIVLGVDGSPGSSAAVRWVAAAPMELKGDVVIVHATEAPLPAILGRTGEGAARPARLAAWAEPITTGGIAVTFSEAESDPVAALRGSAVDHPGSIIVLGGRPLDKHDGLRIGSLALRLLDVSGVPVVIVPPPR